MISPAPSTDPVALLRELTVEQLHARLLALEDEQRGVRVLLRAALARDRRARRQAERSRSPQPQGGPPDAA
jgi:hypothetical protein